MFKDFYINGKLSAGEVLCGFIVSELGKRLSIICGIYWNWMGNLRCSLIKMENELISGRL